MNSAVATTPRLIIRSWQLDDVEFYQCLAKDIGYNCFSPPGYFVVSDDEARERLKKSVELYDTRKVGKFPVFTHDGNIIGTCGVSPYMLDGKEIVELGYRLRLDYWQKGYATEAAGAILQYAFTDLGLNQVSAFAIEQNPASLAVIDKLGFRFKKIIHHADLPHRYFELSQVDIKALKTG